MKRYVCIDGKLIRMDEPELKELAPGAVNGRGVFETMAVYNGKVFAFDPHWERLTGGARLMRIRLPYKREYFRRRLHDVLQKNKLKNARIRLMVVSRSGMVHFNIVASPTSKPSPDVYKRGFALGVSSYKRNRTAYTHVKNIDYGLLHAAHYEARKGGYDEALLLNDRGYCVETAYANLFCVYKNVLITPPVSCGCLNGITRNFILVMARELGIPVAVKNVRLSKAVKAHEIFITNSVLEIMPVTRIDSNRIGDGTAGPVTKILAEAYDQLLEAFKRRIK